MLMVPEKPRAPTRVAALMAEIEGRIAARRLAPGAKLPSVRDLAADHGVSKSTVVEAYERLVAEGAITARRGAGFFVAGRTRPLSLQSLRPDLDRAIDPLWMTRQSLTTGPQVLKPGWGTLPESYMPDAAVQKALRDVSRGPDAASRLSYATPLGFTPMREHVALRLGERGVLIGPDDILLVDSAIHALDLLLRFLIEPGDTVLVDDPCYFNYLAILLSHRVKVVGVPFGAAGPELAALDRIMGATRPRLYIITAGPQNPTGASSTSAVVHRVLTLADRHDVILVEDDTFADFASEPTPRLASFDGLSRVVTIGSFSKTVSAALRCGYLAAKPAWIDALIDLKLATSHGTGHLASAVLHRILTGSAHKRHLDALRAKLARDMGPALHRLTELGLRPLVEPRAGPFVWAELPGGRDAAEVARLALAEDVLFAPGNVFSPSQSARSCMRFNVANCAAPRIWDVLKRTMAAVG